MYSHIRVTLLFDIPAFYYFKSPYVSTLLSLYCYYVVPKKKEKFEVTKGKIQTANRPAQEAEETLYIRHRRRRRHLV